MTLDMTLSMSQLVTHPEVPHFLNVNNVLETQNCGIPTPYKGHDNGLYSSSICHFCSPIELLALAKGKLSEKLQLWFVCHTKPSNGFRSWTTFVWVGGCFWNNLRF